MTIGQLGVRVALTYALFVGLAVGLSPPQTPDKEEPRCPLPLMVCGDDPDSSDARACPPGYRCACVPSCPACLDCAVRVCVLAPPPECRTACDCEPGLGCFEGKCIAGIAPVFCCEGPQCPAGEQCQHRDGRMDRCLAACVDHAWLCRAAGQPDDQCGAGRVCACTASCPTCEDCGQPICVPPSTPPPYRCNDDGTCRQPGDRCICVSSCPTCDDCALNVCVPACDQQCEERRGAVQQRINSVVEPSRKCDTDRDCVHIDTGTACGGTCGALVSQRHAARLEEVVARLDKKFCASYQADGCPFVKPRCEPARAACVEGRCTAVPVGVRATTPAKSGLARPFKHAPSSAR